MAWVHPVVFRAILIGERRTLTLSHERLHGVEGIKLGHRIHMLATLERHLHGVVRLAHQIRMRRMVVVLLHGQRPPRRQTRTHKMVAQARGARLRERQIRTMPTVAGVAQLLNPPPITQDGVHHRYTTPGEVQRLGDQLVVVTMVVGRPVTDG
jgi:hypothetical protein